MATHPARTMVSAMLAPCADAIGSRVESTLASWSGLFPSHSFCGESRILAPLAPPRLSDPLNVEALAHAVSTISGMLSPLDSMAPFSAFTSYPVGPWSTGSCQMNSSSGTSGPRYLDFGPMSRCRSLNHAREKASESSSGLS